MIQIKLVTVEHQVRPIGLDSKTPRFSWQLQSGSTQRAYRIRVDRQGIADEIPKCEATDSGICAGTNIADEIPKCEVWDSGICAGEDCILIQYLGLPLESTRIYGVHLEVFFDDGTNEVANTTFETGLLFQRDWTGCGFLGTNANYAGNSVLLRTVFALSRGDFIRARAYVVGLGYHEVFVNGQKITDDLLAPAVSDFSRRLFYKTYDITASLCQGDNCFAMELGQGWYGRKSAKVKLLVEFSDYSHLEICSQSNGLWWIRGGAYLSNSIYGGEVFDANLAIESGDWKKASYRSYFDNGWMCALYQLAENVVLQADSTEPIRVCGTYSPLSVTKVSAVRVVYDFGYNIAGWVRVRVRGQKGGRMIFSYAEDLDKNGNVNRINLRSANCRDVYILHGRGEEKYEPRFTFHGFRYVELIIEGEVEILEISAQHVHSDVKKTGYFHSSDRKLNVLHECVLRTELNNLHSVMSDCPQRDERFAWLNDLTARIYQSINNFDLFRFLSKTVEDIADTQDENGAIADTAPYLAGFRPADPVSVCFLLFGLMSEQYYGDRSLMEKQYKHYIFWTNYLLGRQNGYIMDYSYYGDWVVPECFSACSADKIFVSSIYLNWQLALLSQIAEHLNEDEVAIKYAQLRTESTAALNAKYFDFSTHRYGDSQGANVMALSIGIAPKEDCAGIAAYVARDIVSRGNHVTIGNQGLRHCFYAMCEAGYTELMLDVLRNPEYPGLGYMMASGATTIWERWEREMHLEMHSLDHPMFTGFDGIFYKYLGGIRIEDDACGCDRVVVRPCFAKGLDFVDCRMDTVRGRISTVWERIAGKIRLTVEVPQTVKVRFDFEGMIDGGCVNREARYGGGTYDFWIEEKKDHEILE